MWSGQSTYGNNLSVKLIKIFFRFYIIENVARGTQSLRLVAVLVGVFTLTPFSVAPYTQSCLSDMMEDKLPPGVKDKLSGLCWAAR